MSVNTSLRIDPRNTEPERTDALSVALIGPDENRRRTMADALAGGARCRVAEITSYPSEEEALRLFREGPPDVVLLDLDGNPDRALALLEKLAESGGPTVMVFSERADQNQMLRCMRAGAREYFLLPLAQGAVAEALTRVARVLQPSVPPQKKVLGRLLAFLGAKGGSGTTTVACNLAIALAQESDESTLLIDLGLPIGDAALNLGIVAEFTTEDALRNSDRLDGSFLLKLLVKHRSGAFILAGPSKVPEVEPTQASLEKMIAVARREFDHVIVDMGTRLDLIGTSLVREASTVYLVSQTSISDLRNANRLIAKYFADGIPKLEVVINRFEPRLLGGLNEDVISNALGRPVAWSIPDDQDAARKLQHGGSSGLPLAETRISRLSREMANSITGRIVAQEKKRGFGLRAFGRNAPDKGNAETSEGSLLRLSPAQRATPTIAWASPDPITRGVPLGAAQLNAVASAPGTLVYTPGPGYLLPPGTHTLWVTFTPEDAESYAPAQAFVAIQVTKAVPSLSWAAPATIVYGTALGQEQLNARAPIPGTFEYSPDSGEVLPAGTHELSVAFTPADEIDYAPARVAVALTVTQATPAIEWAEPAPLSCGEALSGAQLNAVSAIPGFFEYSPGGETLLPAGEHTLSAVFTPSDLANYVTVRATVRLRVRKVAPLVAWPQPEPVVYGTRLTAAQLSPSASVPGSFAFNPQPGALLAAGTHPLSVLFTPEDLSTFSSIRVSTSLVVEKAAPAVTWAVPHALVHGCELGHDQLNASASVPGSFLYSPGPGAQLEPGVHTLSVTFTPSDALNCDVVHAAVPLVVVEPAASAITWDTPAPVLYGTELSAAQLNARAAAPGTFVYTPAAGHVLPPGDHRLRVEFVPEDAQRHAPAHATVMLHVEAPADEETAG